MGFKAYITMLRQTSLGTLGLSVGGFLTVGGFIAYFAGNPTLNLVGFFYGIPILIGGLALKAAELEPVPVTNPTTPQVLKLRQQATTTQNQIRQDVTRYRYGQEAHLDTSLSHLGFSPTDEERPVIKGLRETEINDAYALILEFSLNIVCVYFFFHLTKMYHNYNNLRGTGGMKIFFFYSKLIFCLVVFFWR